MNKKRAEIAQTENILDELSDTRRNGNNANSPGPNQKAVSTKIDSKSPVKKIATK